MSQSYREDCNDHKKVREGIIEPRPTSGKNRKAKPVIVEFRWRHGDAFAFLNKKRPEWVKWNAYRTEEEANRAIELHKRKTPYFELRIRT